MKVALITGGGSGIGKALALELVKQDMQVYIVGRTKEKLEMLGQQHPDRIKYIVADVSTSEGRAAIVRQFDARQLDYLVHNAAITGPLKKLEHMEEAEWRQCFAINVEGPLFLTKALLPYLHASSRLLHLSSGLAHHCLEGMAGYSCSKAAFHMLFQAWNVELAEKSILTGSVRPGIVDTDMQVVLRTESADSEFPSREMFQSFYQEKQLDSPEMTAKLLAYMLIKMSDADYVSQEWDVREAYFNDVRAEIA